MALFAIFILGIANFAMHRAVMNSGHPMLGRSPWYVHRLGGRITLITEFLLLFAAMLLVAEGWAWAAWLYFGYSALNALAAWLILTRRV
ncbi:hypothetical protein A6F68_00505 [Tsuneonella dongtanensis]|uniref:Uncharacterized protein n=1 Tax=Tsuneonella dongtanensis TaxID=692370 RepID=A0A1B2AA53_9SPHN|nr:hypothetical protein [Tsuneonella dongtanensis]ANY19040.1 hypothetical protein A6F68_00505 [Tsuneonella dongtanensis]